MELIRRESSVCLAFISTDSQAAILATRIMRGASGRELVDRVHKQIGEVQWKHRGMRIMVRWTPGHEGILENEKSDAEAKKAVQGRLSPINWLPTSCSGEIPASRSATKQNHMQG